MNLFLKKTAAFIAAGLMATASLGAECFAESAKLTKTRVELSMAATVAKPTYTVKGTPGVRKVRLSTGTAGATIYYTTNGTVPTTKSKVYNGSLIQLTSDTKIKAIAVKGGVSSAVMTKTFYIATKYGDVTGDGQINNNDYSRLKNYIAGLTKFICKDNADCNGSGGISSADLTVLGQYLNNTISTLPYKSSSSVKKPSASMRKIYGGLQITFTPKTSGSTIYYTTNGTTPTTSGTRYTGPFVVSETSQIKAIATKDGQTSAVFSFSAPVGTLSAVVADKSTATQYTGEISVTLSCPSSGARIIYTVDGSDPRTSTTAAVYSSPIRVSKNTTIKAYAQAKAYSDSTVSTFSYNVESSYTIGGIVWDDSPDASTSSNGVRANTEAGISGIQVYLINSTTSAKDAPAYYIQKQLTDSTGRYSFTNLSKDASYKVVFEYNYQKYRAYNSVINGGNQALAYTTIDPIIVRSGGAYTKATGTITGEQFLNSVNKYSDAINSSYYKMYAITTKTYTASAYDVDFALVSKNYGVLDLSMTVTGYDTTNNTVKNGQRLVYTVKLTNNSPLALTTLDQCQVEVQITNAFAGSLVFGQRTQTVAINQTLTTDGNIKFTWNDFVGTAGLAPGKSAELQFEGYIDTSEANKKVYCFAQVISYRFGPNCYDYYSIPGNLSNNTVKERDEATTTVLTVPDTNNTTPVKPDKSMIITPNSMEITAGSYGVLYITIVNGTGTESIQVLHNDSGVISCGSPIRYNAAGSNYIQYYLNVTGLIAGNDRFTLQLVDGSSILSTQNVSVSVKPNTP